MLERTGSPRIGPASTELVVRGLMAGKIPHDCRVQRVGDATWRKILDVDVFHDAMQATVVQTRVQTRKPSDRPPPADTLVTERPDLPEIPESSLEALGRAWHAPEWMLMLPTSDDMRGPISLAEVKRLMTDSATDGAQVCRMRTFDWIAASEAFARAGDEPQLVPSEGRLPVAVQTSTAPPPGARGVGWDEPIYRVRHAGKVQGPTSLAQIVRARDAGRLSNDDEVASRDRDDWVPLGAMLARKASRSDANAPTVILARRLGEEPALPGIGLRRGQWGTWVVVAAVVLAFLYAVIVKLAG
ncbi:MAG: hypothetical protein NVS3B10_19420 [Polyangiales bacterium]